jgi:hypothetical protein
VRTVLDDIKSATVRADHPLAMRDRHNETSSKDLPGRTSAQAAPGSTRCTSIQRPSQTRAATKLSESSPPERLARPSGALAEPTARAIAHELSSIQPVIKRKVSVLRRTLQLQPWQVSWLKDGTRVSAAYLPQRPAEWSCWQLLFVYSGGTAPVSLRTSLLSPQRAPWVIPLVSRPRTGSVVSASPAPLPHADIPAQSQAPARNPGCARSPG